MGGLGAIVFIAALPHVKAFKPCARGDPVIPVLVRRLARLELWLKP